MKADDFDPSTGFGATDPKNILKSADDVRKENLAKLMGNPKRTSDITKRIKPEDVPSDDDIMREDARKEERKEVREVKPLPVKTMQDGIAACLANRVRITFRMETGDITVPAVDVIEGQLGLMILMPNGLNDISFSPTPGTHLTLKVKEKEYSCFSTGTVFNLTFLDLIAIVLMYEGKT